MSGTELGVWATISCLFFISSVFWAGWNAKDREVFYAFMCCVFAGISGVSSASLLMQIGGAS